MNRESRRGGVQVQSVARVAQILDCFREKSEMGISELAVEMGLNKSTVYGLVNTLAAYGYLEQLETNKKYALGLTLLELGSLVTSRIDLRNEARLFCAPLVAKYPAILHIATHAEGEVIYIDKLDQGHSLINVSSIGRRAPMYCTGVGKAMLAFLPDDYLEKYVFTHEMRKITKNTIVTPDEMRQELMQVRETGIATDNEEIELGVNCIAAPIFNHHGVAEMAVSLSFSFGRIATVDQEMVKAQLLECTRKVSERLNYRG